MRFRRLLCWLFGHTPTTVIDVPITVGAVVRGQAVAEKITRCTRCDLVYWRMPADAAKIEVSVVGAGGGGGSGRNNKGEGP